MSEVAYRPNFIDRITRRIQTSKESPLIAEWKSYRQLNDSVSIRVREYDIARKQRSLSDGTIIRVGEPICNIDILPKNKEGESVAQYGRRVHEEVKKGLEALAHLAQESDEVLKRVKVFGGVSRFAPLAKHYGFDTFEISGELQELYQEKAKKYTFDAIGNNRLLIKLHRDKAKAAPLEVLISRGQLIRLYGKVNDIDK